MEAVAAELRPLVRRDLDVRPVGNQEFVVKDLVLDRYYQFNIYQVTIMRALDGKRRISDVVDYLEDELGVAISQRDVWLFVYDLGRRFLLEVESLGDLPEALRVKAARAALAAWKRGRLLEGLPDEDAPGTDDVAFLRRAAERLAVNDLAEASKSLAVAEQINPQNERVREAARLVRRALLEATPKPKTPWPVLPLFDPYPLLRWANRWLGFVFTKTFVVLLVAATLFSALLLAIASDRLGAAAALDKWGGARLGGFIAVGLVALLLHELSHGLACTHYGGKPKSVGVMLMYYAIPAAYCDVSDAYQFTDRRAKLATFAGGLVANVIIFNVATVIWFFTKEQTTLSEVAFLTISANAFAVVVNMLPTLKQDGYFIVCTVLDERRLEEDAWAHFQGRVRRAMGKIHPLIARLALVGIVNLAVVPALVFCLLGYFGQVRSVILMVVAIGTFRLWWVARRPRSPGQRIRALRIFASTALTFRLYFMFFIATLWWQRAVPTLRAYGVLFTVLIVHRAVRGVIRTVTTDPSQRQAQRPPLAARMRASLRGLLRWGPLATFWLAFDVGLLLVVPWSQSALGELRIEAAVQRTLRAPVAGRIVEVPVRDGRAVRKGELLVRLTDAALLTKRDKAAAEHRRCLAELEILRTGPSAAERLLQRRIMVATQLRDLVAAAQLKRRSNLSAVLPRSEIDDARAAAAQTRADGAVTTAGARAALSVDRERVGTKKAECSVLAATFKLTRETVGHLRVTAPIGGRVTSDRPHERVGEWVERGDPLLEISDPKSIRASIWIDKDQPPEDLEVGCRALLILSTGTSLEAKVSWVAPKLDETGRLELRARLLTPLPWGLLDVRGRARVVGQRRSLFTIVARPVRTFFNIDFWILV